MELKCLFGNRDQPNGKRVQMMQGIEFECHITKGYVYRLILMNTGIVAVIHFSSLQSLDSLILFNTFFYMQVKENMND